MASFLNTTRPEVRAGGFTRYEGAVQFFTRVQSLLGAEMTVMDFGAGRGLFQEDANLFRRNLRTLKGRVARVIGVDVDDAVLINEGVDERVLIEPGATLPFEPASFDMVVSDWVLEHLDDPRHFAAEMGRVLKSGGWLCARTPNKWGLTALVARLIPNSLHAGVLSSLQEKRQEKDIFPTRYKLNTLRDLKRMFPESDWEHCSYLWRGEPKYFGNSLLLYRLMEGWNATVPSFMATDLFVFLRKRS
ncbi:MAG: class I SAM-dependent methyltransferase [Parvibaculum sp.]|nr:class I SAM-dependent methyltransferase [Parvibaculum sp.]